MTKEVEILRNALDSINWISQQVTIDNYMRLNDIQKKSANALKEADKVRDE